MLEKRFNKIEEKVETLEKVFYKVEASLENIEKNMSNALSVKDDVTTHTEKHKVSEARIDNLEKHDTKMDDKVNNMNIKIALATGVWGVLYFIGKEVIGNL